MKKTHFAFQRKFLAKSFSTITTPLIEILNSIDPRKSKSNLRTLD